MENITRISDLPENITVQIPNSYGGSTNQMQQQGLQLQGLQQGFQQGTQQGLQQGTQQGLPHGMPQGLQPIHTQQGGYEQSTPTNYIPINIHPNPYGISPQNPILAPQTGGPQQRQPPPLSEQHQMELQNMAHHRLPSRDIPIDTAGYLNDEQIQANYVPKVKLTKDYIKDYEEVTDKKIREHEEKKYRENRIDSLLSEFQVPIFIMILFFFFQLPIVNSMIFKKFSFLSIYNMDGNFNFYGLLLKSILFGGLYYSIQKAVTLIVEF
jgi:hypothetical protein